MQLQQPPSIPEDVKTYVDLGYLGIVKDFAEMEVKILLKITGI